MKTTPAIQRQDRPAIPVVKAGVRGTTGRHEQDSCGLPAVGAASSSDAAEKGAAALSYAIAKPIEDIREKARDEGHIMPPLFRMRDPLPWTGQNNDAALVGPPLLRANPSA
jgi:hypothetical protein